MKNVGIITIIDNGNYGNRLQNYATHKLLLKMKNDVITLKNAIRLNNYDTKIRTFLKIIKTLKEKKHPARNQNFKDFNKNIKFNKNDINLLMDLNKKFDYFIVGSDQVWNPEFGRLRDVDLLSFALPEKRVAFSASFGMDKLPKENIEKVKKELLKFKAISVREDAGKKIIEDLTGRKDIEVLIDPTMMLKAEEWDEVSKKPKQLKTDKYILNYFLGQLSNERKKEIERIAKENDCEIINILDKDSPFYEIGPSEFLYLEKNAFLICTDSFHSSVFAIIYNRPFVVFEREDGLVSMNSRIETLLNKFELQDRKYNGRITNKLLENDYKKAYEILEIERQKSEKFLKKALNIN